ncbi:Uncharacterised protein [Haemophilus parahaemolyticus]|uniref:Uncharacterized protein n=1 Tax=Haemophilus parahaemolyticus TaxID=735 RepID=A0A377HZK4_HAEPH|nr:Uncharacterised protein [Haemophilus parahaemolyticus]
MINFITQIGASTIQFIRAFGVLLLCYGVH